MEIIELLLKMSDRYGHVKLSADGKNKADELTYKLYFGENKVLFGTKESLKIELGRLANSLRQ